MKKMFGLAVIALLGLSAPSFAQDNSSTKDKVENGAKKAWHGTKKGAKKAWHATKKGAKTAGNETAELTSKGWAKITDKKSDQWTGPNGQNIYVTDDNRYYWVNEKGKRVYENQQALKARNQ